MKFHDYRIIVLTPTLFNVSKPLWPQTAHSLGPYFSTCLILKKSPYLFLHIIWPVGVYSNLWGTTKSKLKCSRTMLGFDHFRLSQRTSISTARVFLEIVKHLSGTLATTYVHILHLHNKLFCEIRNYSSHSFIRAAVFCVQQERFVFWGLVDAVSSVRRYLENERSKEFEMSSNNAICSSAQPSVSYAPPTSRNNNNAVMRPFVQQNSNAKSRCRSISRVRILIFCFFLV